LVLFMLAGEHLGPLSGVGKDACPTEKLQGNWEKIGGQKNGVA